MLPPGLVTTLIPRLLEFYKQLKLIDYSPTMKGLGGSEEIRERMELVASPEVLNYLNSFYAAVRDYQTSFEDTVRTLESSLPTTSGKMEPSGDSLAEAAHQHSGDAFPKITEAYDRLRQAVREDLNPSLDMFDPHNSVTEVTV